MDYKRVLTIQDISCVGQCSLTVALPILSACGHETAILPSAVLSTHTAGFTGFTFRDLAEDIPAISAHWQKEGILFDAVYTGYLGSEAQIDMVLDIVSKCSKPGAKFICDPAFADNGRLYPAFDKAYVKAMSRLVQSCDIVVPNISEAAFLVGYEYKENYGEEYVRALMNSLCRMGAKSVVLTGVGYDAQSTGVAVYENGQYEYYRHKKYERGCHGTGDVYASAFTGAYMRGHSLFDSARIAADYTLKCIEYSQGDENHTYGPKFEPVLSDLIKAL